VRRELAARTVFNVLGPLTNPAGARAQIVGVYSPLLVPVIADVLAKLGARRAFVVHGAGGIDELSPAGSNLVHEVVEGDVHRREIDPADFGVERCDPAELRGGTAEENAAKIRDVFSGANGGRRAAILLNAAGAIAAGGHAADLAEGYAIACEALDSGAAGERLEALVAFSQGTVAARDSGKHSPRPASARSPSSSGGRRRRATSARTATSPRSRGRTSAPALGQCRCSSTSASPARGTTCARRARRRRCRCSRRASSATTTTCARPRSPARTPRCCCCAISTTRCARG